MNIKIRLMKVLAGKKYCAATEEMKTRMYSGLGLLLSLVLFACAVPASAQAPDLYNNTNVNGVNNGPTSSPQFVLNAPARITQDVNRGPGFGVTVFRLTNVSVSGNVVTAQAPNLPIYQNRTYHVALFVYGQQPWKTANPGQITIR